MSDFDARWQTVLASLDAVADFRVVALPARVPPWTDSGLRVEAGDRVTLLATGEICLSAELDLRGLASFHLWARVGGRGPLQNGTRDTTTFRAPRAGSLELAVYHGEWATPDGELATPIEAYETLGGGFTVVAIRWRGDAEAGLAALAAAIPDDPLVAGERERLASARRDPQGWSHLWFLGPSEIFSSAAAGREIHVRTHRDVGIVRKRAALDLTPHTELAWSWRVSKLPAAVAEDTAVTHDYLSIAVEFENGLDLTYYWSAALPVETHYRCPLPTWTARETHLVVRSGAADLGRWIGERRNVVEDYRRAIGGPPPERIVAVWLIAVSLFRRGTGEADFRDVLLGNERDSLRLL